MSGDNNADTIYYKHAKAIDIKRALGDEYARYFKFSVVRNPFTWVISNYEFNRGLHRPFIRSTFLKVSKEIPKWAINMSFSDWLLWWFETFHPSQKQFVVDEKGDLIIDYIIKFENLQSGFNIVSQKIGIPPSRLPHLRKSQNKPKDIRAYFQDAKTIELVIHNLRDDFRFFGYAHNIPDSG